MNLFGDSRSFLLRHDVRSPREDSNERARGTAPLIERRSDRFIIKPRCFSRPFYGVAIILFTVTRDRGHLSSLGKLCKNLSDVVRVAALLEGAAL